ncbi:MAG: HlyC/CorC family transporter [Geodermatophilaceae bacterium]|nr:HlyC/CorC family transporter [Geodermatophilaceae bacterium]
MSDLLGIAIAVVLLAANAFFVGAEFALISARRSQIEPRARAGSRAARITLRAMENVSLMMAGAQLGITVCSLGLGAIGEPAVAHLLEPLFEAINLPEGLVYPISFTIALLIVVALHVVIGEMVPKNLALAGPERSALLLGPPLVLVVRVLKPLLFVVNGLANGLLRLVRVQPQDEVGSTFTREQVSGLVEESRRQGLIEADEYDLLAAALGFTDRSVETVLLPSDQLTTIPRGGTLTDVEKLCTESGYSRFPVADDSGDLIGYLHIKDVLETDVHKRARPLADKWIRPLASVRPTDRLHAALRVMQARGTHMARVVRDDGTLVGIVTLEDVLEELVGEIRDATQQIGGGSGRRVAQ